jgi:hypothetical protein
MKEIKLTGKNFDKLKTKSVFFEDNIYGELSKQKTKEGGAYLDLIASGMGVRGFKHLLETLENNDNKAKIVFTKGQTKKQENDWHINLDEYKRSASGRFFSLYRETGIDGALFYLSQKIPDHFTYDGARVSEKDVKKISKNLSEILDKIGDKRKDREQLLSKTTKIVSELGTKKKKIKKEIESLEAIKKASNIASMLSTLEEFGNRLSGTKIYRETSGKNSWQEWLRIHSWVFGVYYEDPYEKTKVGFSSIPDYLFPTVDGFVDIFEIKLPSHDVIKQDPSHPGSYMWSSKANEAIGQCVNYLHEIELHQLELMQKIDRAYQVKLSFIKPRAFVVIGDKSKVATDEEKDALRKLNFSLHGMEVITYSDLEERGKQILNIYGYKG